MCEGHLPVPAVLHFLLVAFGGNAAGIMQIKRGKTRSFFIGSTMMGC